MRKTISVLVAVLMVVGIAAGCAKTTTETSGTASSEASTQASQATTSEGASEPVTLRMMWWGGDARHEATLAMLDRYKELTGVTIQAEYQGWDGYEQKLMTQLASNTAPDIVQIDSPWLLNFAEKELFVNLKDNPAIDLSEFDTDFLEASCTVNGILSGLPCGVNAFRFVANADFLEEYGVDPTKTYTWDEWFALGEQIHSENPDAYLMIWDPSESWTFFENYIRNKTGDYIIGDDFTIHATRDEIIEALNMLKKMYDTNTALPLSEVQPFFSAMDTSPKWINGELGGMPDYTSKIATWTASSENPITTMNMPIPTGAAWTGDTYRPAMLWGVPKCSKNSEEALKFLQWALTDPEAALLLGTVRSVPAAKSSYNALVEAGVLDSVLVEAIEAGAANKVPAAPYVLGDAEIGQIFFDIYNEVAVNQGAIEAIADELISRLQIRLNEMSG
jgi:oligogalacturonide transport system substrate-binding protein